MLKKPFAITVLSLICISCATEAPKGKYYHADSWHELDLCLKGLIPTCSVSVTESTENLPWEKVSPEGKECYSKDGERVDISNCIRAKEFSHSLKKTLHFSPIIPCEKISWEVDDYHPLDQLKKELAECKPDLEEKKADADLLRPIVTVSDPFIVTHLPLTVKQIKDDLKRFDDTVKKIPDEEKKLAEKIEKAKGPDEKTMKKKVFSFYRITPQESNLEVIQGDNVGGIGLPLYALLYGIEDSKTITILSRDHGSNKLGKQILISGKTTLTNDSFQISFTVNEKYAKLNYITARDQRAFGADAVMVLQQIMMGN